jgi:hypothetical protein
MIGVEHRCVRPLALLHEDPIIEYADMFGLQPPWCSSFLVNINKNEGLPVVLDWGRANETEWPETWTMSLGHWLEPGPVLKE